MKKSVIGAALLLTSAPLMAQSTDLIEGNWELQVETDAMTDATIGRLVKAGSDNKSLIALKCDKAGPKSVYLHVIGNEWLGGDETRRMMVRFGSEEAANINMYAKERSALVFDFKRVQVIARKMMQSEKVAFRLTSYRYAQSDVSFDLSGAATEIPKLFAACRAPLA